MEVLQFKEAYNDIIDAKVKMIIMIFSKDRWKDTSFFEEID